MREVTTWTLPLREELREELQDIISKYGVTYLREDEKFRTRGGIL